MPSMQSATQTTNADEGEGLHFCNTCAFSSICIDAGYDKPTLRDLHVMVEHVGPYHAGEHIFRTNDPFRALYAVRSGAVKTLTVDTDGSEQVLGFYLPGELVGLNAIYPKRFPCDAVTLESSQFCRFSFSAISALATRMPMLQQQLFRMLSRELGMASRLAGDHSADERVAAFLTDLAQRFAAQGFPARYVHLAMTRNEIAEYLRLASETISRILGRFRNQGLIRVDGRDVEIIDSEQLNVLAHHIFGG